MKLYEAIASAIAGEADGPIFGLMGDGNMMLWSTLTGHPHVKIFSARHEAGAVAMADGYFRATGHLAIATVTHGPGLAQVGTSLVAAARNRTPMVLVVGDVPPGARNQIQAFDHRKFAEACEAHYRTVTSAADAADEIAEAFFHARLHAQPVVLNLPLDLQGQEAPAGWTYTASRQWLPASEAAAGEEAVEQLFQALTSAERPVIVAGRGARTAGARNDLAEIGGRIGALLGTSLQAKGLFDGHEYDVGIVGSLASAPTQQLLRDADLVCGFGAELGWFATEDGRLFPKARIARVDIAPAPRGLGRLPGLYVRGEAGGTARRLVHMLEERQVRRRGYHGAETRKALAFPGEPREPAKDGLDPRLLMRHLAAAVPPEAIVTSGVGHFFAFVAEQLALPASVDIQFVLQFGAVGQALPTAMGIGVGNPGRPHLVIEGDGSLMMHVQELDSIVRQEVPMVLLVLNDRAYGAEVHKLGISGGNPELARHGSPDFVAVAKGFGGDGVRLRKEEDIGGAVMDGFRKGGLFLIDARISPTTLTDSYERTHLRKPNRTPLPRSRPAKALG